MVLSKPADFKLSIKPDEDIIEAYTGVLPDTVIQFWKDYGFGTANRGYFKFVNPENFKFLFHTGQDKASQIVFMATPMCDCLIWNTVAGKVMMLNCRRGTINTISSSPKMFFTNLYNPEYCAHALDWEPFPAARDLLGEPGFDECYCYLPILKVGGIEQPDHLIIGNLLEHINLCMAFNV